MSLLILPARTSGNKSRTTTGPLRRAHPKTLSHFGNRAGLNRCSERFRVVEQRPTGTLGVVTRPDRDVVSTQSGEDLLGVHVEFGGDVGGRGVFVAGSEPCRVVEFVSPALVSRRRCGADLDTGRHESVTDRYREQPSSAAIEASVRVRYCSVSHSMSSSRSSTSGSDRTPPPSTRSLRSRRWRLCGVRRTVRSGCGCEDRHHPRRTMLVDPPLLKQTRE